VYCEVVPANSIIKGMLYCIALLQRFVQRLYEYKSRQYCMRQIAGNGWRHY